ncbi:DMT family transporter [Paraurantiacibacter namhicola]|uniref:EamA-like transporter family protein n=1 Tax=Paraurantiacibacter namhicola TaxID=645517 RepID=A0A1C7DB71_9SPHN|nr:DMT family transporter [Paraurantiacibacter namhicola]ANU08750.1 EamA-like transporter family protein [Paraurantiacibacter namhicola]
MEQRATQSAGPAPLLPLLALLAGNAALAMGPWLVRLADTGPVSAAFWRLFLAIPFLALLARGSGQKLSGLGRGTMLALAAAGAFFAFDLASWHIGIEMTRLANATLFGNAGSVVLMAWTFIALKTWPQGREALAILAALAGAAILLGRSMDISATNLAGDLFCLLAGLLYAGYLLILQDKRGTLGGWALLTWSSIAAACVLLPLALVRGEPVWPGNWTPVVILALSSQLIGQGLLVYSLRHFSPLAIGVALLTQPAIGALVGWYAFAELLVPLDIAGMVLLGSALAIARSSTPRVRAPSTKPASADSP